MESTTLERKVPRRCARTYCPGDLVPGQSFIRDRAVSIRETSIKIDRLIAAFAGGALTDMKPVRVQIDELTLIEKKPLNLLAALESEFHLLRQSLQAVHRRNPQTQAGGRSKPLKTSMGWCTEIVIKRSRDHLWSAADA